MVKVPAHERKLNEEQKQAVEFGEGPLLIIAGAGTGKTTVVTERIKYLLSSGRAEPQEILALTFTEKASREMEERVDIGLPYGALEMWISTFHSFCDRILRNEAINIGLDPGYKLMTEAETVLFFRNHLFEFDLDYFRPLGNPTKFIRGMIQHFSRFKDEDVSPSQYLDWAQVQSSKFKVQSDEQKDEIKKIIELAHAFRKYEELKVKEGVADYADLISNTLKLFRTRGDILKKYQDQFKYLLVDEFQDTNFAQSELAILLAGKRKNITVVGDDDQAIYRWRGAAVSNMIQFRKRFPDAQVVVLTKNYRSTQEILDRSYDLIQNNNPDRLEVAEKIDKKLESIRRIKGTKIQLFYEDRVENEADAVAKEILKFTEESKGEYTWADFAILVRANNHAEPFLRAFARSGIPYQFLGPGQLFRQPEVKDLIVYLKVLANYEDNVAMYRVLSMEYLNLPARDVATIINFARKYSLSLFEACELLSGKSINRQISSFNKNLTSETRFDTTTSRNDVYEKPFVSKDSEKKIKQLVEIIHKHLGLLKKESAGQILYYFLQESGLLQQFVTYKNAREERIVTNIAKFFDKLKTYEVEHEDASVFAVVDWIDLATSFGESPLASDIDWTENNAVNILTVHSAKGLEFPVVFLVNLVSARFPTTERKEQIPIPDEFIKEILPEGDFHLEEERRLFYVGMTRARNCLYFTGAKYYGEGKREKNLSPFVIETLGFESVKKIIETQKTHTQQLTLLGWEKNENKESTENFIRQPITYLSYSQLDTYVTCPLQYKYRYILRIPMPPVASLTFGDIMHKTIRLFYEHVKAGNPPEKSDLPKLLASQWTSVGFGDKKYEEKMKLHALELLNGFYDKGYDPGLKPRDLEIAVKIKISPVLKLGGKIDRVDRLSDGKIEIIDYKTGQAPKNRDVTNDLQLTLYALAATDEGMYYKEPQDVIVSFYFFEGQTKVSATRTREQLAKAKEDIAKKAQEISVSTFTPLVGRHCEFCEFRLICEAWQ